MRTFGPRAIVSHFQLADCARDPFGRSAGSLREEKMRILLLPLTLIAMILGLMIGMAGLMSFAYLVLVICSGGQAIFHGALWPGITGLVAPFLAFIAGGGIAAGLKMPDHRGYRLGVVTLGACCLATSTYWISVAGWYVQFFSFHFSGVAWCLIGFGTGLLFGLREQGSRVAVTT